MKKSILILLAIVFLIGPVSPSFAKKYNWKMVSYMPPGKTFNQEIKKFAEIVEAETNGDVKFTIYEGTLGAPPDHWEMTKNNVVQLCYTSNSFNSSRLKVISLVDFPFEFPDSRCEKKVLDAWKEAGYLKELTDDFKVLTLIPTSPMNVFFTKKKVKSLDDWKNLKIRTPSSAQALIISALGGSTVSMPGSETYMALSTGVIDGLITSVESIHDRKTYEVTKYAMKSPPICYGAQLFLMNKDLWNSLPADLQSVLDRAAKKIGDDGIDMIEKNLEQLWPAVSKHLEIYNLDKEESQQCRKATAAVSEKYLRENASPDNFVTEAYQMMQKIIADY